MAVLQRQSLQPCSGSRFVKDAPDASDLGVETCVVLVSGFQRVFGRRRRVYLDSSGSAG